MTFYPQHIYQKKRNLDTILRKQRKLEPNLRTQIRLGVKDIELFTKNVGDFQWCPTPISHYVDPNVRLDITPPPHRGSNPFAQNKRKISSTPKEDETPKRLRVDELETDMEVFENLTENLQGVPKVQGVPKKVDAEVSISETISIL